MLSLVLSDHDQILHKDAVEIIKDFLGREMALAYALGNRDNEENKVLKKLYI